MMRFKYLPTALICLYALAGPLALRAQITPNPPISELRGVWIASVSNIDWPSSPFLTPERQRVEFDSLLDVLKAMGMNAVFVQIRPAGDALYPNTFAPWSKFLTGKQGQAPEPMYDPLAYMIKAAHSRRMEFHAWMNPYRATVDLDTANLAATHPMKALPPSVRDQWFFKYGQRYYFNPANPLVVKYLNNIVRDVAVRYNIDGIHFDDYFYPYKEQGQEIYDYDQFAADPRGYINIEDWRRDNVNRLIESVHKTIKDVKPYVRFGISPFGVWRNAAKDPLNGSATNAGLTSYDDLYADVLLWLKNGWIDYVAPQLYWSIGFPPADYKVLTEWWSKRVNGKHLYIGHAAYKINSDPKDPNWNQRDQISRQVALNRSIPNIQGSIYFSTKPLLRNPLGVQDSMIQNLYNRLALAPPVQGTSKIVPATPQICRIEGSPSSIKLAWHACDILSGEEMPYYFGIYRFPGDQPGDFRDAKNLIAITPYDNEKWTFEDQNVLEGEYYTYVIVAYGRTNIGGFGSDPMMVKKTKKSLKRKRPLVGYLFR